MKIKVNNRIIKIEKKHSFFQYYKDIILKISRYMFGLMCIIFVGIIAIICKEKIINNLHYIINIIINNLHYIIALLFAVPVIYKILKSCYRFAKYLNAHLHIPLTHEELVANEITSLEEYIQVILAMFYICPMKKARKDISETCLNEFGKELYLKNYYYSPSIKEFINNITDFFNEVIALLLMGDVFIILIVAYHLGLLPAIFVLLMSLVVLIGLVSLLYKGEKKSWENEKRSVLYRDKTL